MTDVLRPHAELGQELLTPEDIESIRRYADEVATKGLPVGVDFAKRLWLLLAAHERLMGLSTEVQEWVALPTTDDNGESAAFGIFVAGCEDDGWLVTHISRALAETIVDLHNLEFRAVQEAIYPPLPGSLGESAAWLRRSTRQP